MPNYRKAKLKWKIFSKVNELFGAFWCLLCVFVICELCWSDSLWWSWVNWMNEIAHQTLIFIGNLFFSVPDFRHNFGTQFADSVNIVFCNCLEKQVPVYSTIHTRDTSSRWHQIMEVIVIWTRKFAQFVELKGANCTQFFVYK